VRRRQSDALGIAVAAAVAPKGGAMKRLMATFIIAMFVFAVPGIAMTKTVKEAEKQCRMEYNEAKKQAGTLKTHKERVDAKRDAKKKYDECIETAKHKS
jgi:hypothetical protein